MFILNTKFKRTRASELNLCIFKVFFSDSFFVVIFTSKIQKNWKFSHFFSFYEILWVFNVVSLMQIWILRNNFSNLNWILRLSFRNLYSDSISHTSPKIVHIFVKIAVNLSNFRFFLLTEAKFSHFRLFYFQFCFENVRLQMTKFGRNDWYWDQIIPM